MIITLCLSMSFIDRAKSIKGFLEKKGHSVFLPIGNFKEEECGELKIKHELIKRHFEKIDKSDAILVVNYDKNGIKNYVGGNAFLEMGKAYDKGIPIFLLNPVPDVLYKDEIIGMKPIILNGDLERIRS